MTADTLPYLVGFIAAVILAGLAANYGLRGAVLGWFLGLACIDVIWMQVLFEIAFEEPKHIPLVDIYVGAAGFTVFTSLMWAVFGVPAMLAGLAARGGLGGGSGR